MNKTKMSMTSCTYLNVFLCIFLTSCTLSMQNVTNVTVNGESTDTVDDAQSPTNDVKPDVNLTIPTPI